MNFKKFEHKNILVTGASSGIGEAITYLLAQADANLYLAGRDWKKLSVVREKCMQSGSADASSKSDLDTDKADAAITDKVQIFQVDFSDTSSIDNFVSDITGKNIFFDYIILNAGISQRALTLDTDFEVDRKIMDTNYFGPVYLTKKLSGMLKSDQMVHIAVTSSISGLFGYPLRSAYCASKHALFGFFESLELEYENIKVTFLIPGRINTPISKSAVLGDGSAYAKMDSGQADGMDVNKCARIALRAIAKGKHRKLIGGKELLMVYIKKFVPSLFFKIARNISAT
ncbi:MAG: SDR family NAD(P)-dependent oxidoreductase [Tannerella sp.]|jgi:short-subunit dehydrogenase|nr:SDR family NAD(P)-dependent oxidoreductase [Tannerella sp.]